MQKKKKKKKEPSCTFEYSNSLRELESIIIMKTKNAYTADDALIVVLCFLIHKSNKILPLGFNSKQIYFIKQQVPTLKQPVASIIDVVYLRYSSIL